MDSFGLLIGLVYALLTFVVPIAIIVIVVRLVTRHDRGTGNGGSGLNTPASQVTPKQATLAVLAVAAGYSGIAAVYQLPTWVLNITDEGTIFGFRLVCGLVVLGVGLATLKQKLVSTLLMSVGVISMVLAAPYIFRNFGSSGILLVIFLVFAVLIGAAVFFSRKGEHA